MTALVASPGCCAEASMFSTSTYIPCNAPATKVVGWKGRDDPAILMCDACADHNVKNRGGFVVGPAPHLSSAAERLATLPGPSLMAQERAVSEYRAKMHNALGEGGKHKASFRVDGFRDGWQAAMAYVRAAGVP